MKRTLMFVLILLPAVLFAADLDFCIAAEKAYWIAIRADASVNGDLEGERALNGERFGDSVLTTRRTSSEPSSKLEMTDCRFNIDGKTYTVTGTYTFNNTVKYPDKPAEEVNVTVNGKRVRYSMSQSSSGPQTRPALSGDMSDAVISALYCGEGEVDIAYLSHRVIGRTEKNLTFNEEGVEEKTVFTGTIDGKTVEASITEKIKADLTVDGKKVSAREFCERMIQWEGF